MGQIHIVDVEKLGATVPQTDPDRDRGTGTSSFFDSSGGSSESRGT